jgi:hypothetical protein
MTLRLGRGALRGVIAGALSSNGPGAPTPEQRRVRYQLKEGVHVPATRTSRDAVRELRAAFLAVDRKQPRAAAAAAKAKANGGPTRHLCAEAVEAEWLHTTHAVTIGPCGLPTIDPTGGSRGVAAFSRGTT